ncbi:MAG: metal-sulfur cluster assembly factor [Candidatus Levybacteria bacterium]|nr:metal-sulfur cluster assembly factor [Candidatus Levybacteria bacterium]
MVTKEKVFEKLREVIDPELNVNIVDLGLIYDVKIESARKTKSHPGVASTTIGSRKQRDSIATPQEDLHHKGTTFSEGSLLRSGALQNDINVDVKMTLTSPGCPLSFIFEEWIRDAIKKIKGVKNVTIDLVWEPAWSPDKMTEEAKEKVGILE